ncbi:MAG: imidazoleglycerol-phosphate dehydratase HisB [Deltaproteobacteria bacterium]
MKRKATLSRKTTETDIRVSLCLDGKGAYRVRTGISFLDHMLALLSRHSLIDLDLVAKGDIEVDIHHTNEDVALVLGEALDKALGKRVGIKRFGEATVPMDEALVRAAVDVSGRPFLKISQGKGKIKDMPEYSLNYAEQFFRALTTKAGLTLHIDILDGRDAHHVLEAAFKAVAKALLRALEKEARSGGVPSTKGQL